jgi:urease accessory protein
MDPARSAVRELSDVGRSGRIELRFGLKDGRTVIRHVYSEVPHKITRLYYPERSTLPQLILMNSTAGLFPGDRVEIDIHVEPGARVLITPQASTRIHPGGGVAEQHMRATVDGNGELYYLNEPLIPFRGARLKQRVELRVSKDGRLFFWDAFMSGRVDRGERWEMDELDSETRLSRDNDLTYLERFHIQPGRQDFDYVSTGLFTASAFPADLAGPHLGVDEPAPGVTIVRAVAGSGTQYREVRGKVLSAAFAAIGEEVPDLRKS